MTAFRGDEIPLVPDRREHLRQLQFLDVGPRPVVDERFTEKPRRDRRGFSLLHRATSWRPSSLKRAWESPAAQPELPRRRGSPIRRQYMQRRKFIRKVGVAASVTLRRPSQRRPAQDAGSQHPDPTTQVVDTLDARAELSTKAMSEMSDGTGSQVQDFAVWPHAGGASKVELHRQNMAYYGQDWSKSGLPFT